MLNKVHAKQKQSWPRSSVAFQRRPKALLAVSRHVMYRVQIWLIHYLECLLENSLAHILNNCYRYCCNYKSQEALHDLISGHTGTGLKKRPVKRIYNKEQFLCYLAQDDFPMMIHSHFVRIVRMWNNICNVAFPSSFTSLSDFKSSLMNMYKSVLMSVFEVCPKSISRDCPCHHT